MCSKVKYEEVDRTFHILYVPVGVIGKRSAPTDRDDDFQYDVLLLRRAKECGKYYCSSMCEVTADWEEDNDGWNT